ncbi:MAG: hypothetical protein H6741_20060 [Alphaproteobacteria bacterium]|nr:hypothetical protein [Alphaproteobacteria bacterium]
MALATWPGPFADGALGHPYGDLADHYWGAWWIGERLLGGELPLHTALTHQPEGGALWHVDPIGGLITLLLRPLGFPLAWNLLVVGHVLLAALVARAMALDLTGSLSGATAAGVLVGTSPYLLGLAHSGLTEYLGLAPALGFTWALLAAMGRREQGRVHWLIAALLLGLCTAQAFYYGAFGLLLGLCLVPGRGWGGRALTLLKVGAVWALLAAPMLALVFSTLHAPDAAFSQEAAPGWSYASLPATDLMSWLRPGAWYHPDTPAMGNPGILHVNYVGWVALALALLGALRGGRALAPGAGLYGLFALGPVLSWDRAPVRVAGVLVLLPLALAYAPGSPFRFVHHPYRMVALWLPLLALLLAHGVAALPRLARPLVPLLLALEALGASPAPWPLAVTPLPDPSPYESLDAPGAVLDWPPDASTANRRYLMAQVAHGRPIAAGVNHFLSERLRSDPLVSALLRDLQDPQRRARNRDVPARGPVLRPARPGESQLGALGFAYVVLHEDELSPQEWARSQRTLARSLGPPRFEGDGWAAYAVDLP